MLYSSLLIIHNAFRWFVLVSILATLISSYSGWLRPRMYSAFDQTIRVTATSIVHTQLLIGFYLYFISPIVNYYWRFSPDAGQAPEFRFFSVIHISLMFTSVIITVGSSLTKRKSTAHEKFKTTAIYFTLGLLLILIAIPWPFSPLAVRPWTRLF